MSHHESLDRRLDQAAEAIRTADAILIGAGAGMGVDSGLPDFRGRQGFWNAYPPYAKLGLDFVSLANPGWFTNDPELAWGFYGHRMMLYRNTKPHGGFAILRRWISQKTLGGFVYTSNVDGHFQAAGFSPEQIYEVHGAVGAMQCLASCGVGIFTADAHSVVIDEETMRAVPPLPRCPRCGDLARPNILMFGDWGWDPSHAEIQHTQLKLWLRLVSDAELVIIECGAGTAVPTVRLTCEDIARHHGATLIRINVREFDVPTGQIPLPMGALEALGKLDERLAAADSRGVGR